MINHCSGCNNTQSVLHAPVMEDTPAAAGNGIRELTGDELALVSGGSIWTDIFGSGAPAAWHLGVKFFQNEIVNAKPGYPHPIPSIYTRK